MVINGAGPTSKTLTHYYDRWLRPYATGYPDGEVVKVSYNGLGLPKLLCASYWNSSDQSYWCTGAARYADNASYDVSGRLTQVQYPAGGLWRTQSYYPWTGQAANGGMLQILKVGTTQGGSNILNLTYSYDRFGNVASLNDNGSVSNFGYDAFNRLTSAYGQSFSYWSTGRFNTFNGATYVYGSFPFHAVDKVNGVDLYNYDDNGNMTVRNMGLPNRQNLTWNAENRLEQVTNTSGGVVESYAYDDNGQRIRRTAGNTTTYTFFDIYEEERTGSTVTPIKYYIFNGQRIALRRGSTLSYLHGDHLGSTVQTTTGTSGSRRYHAYGTVRTTGGTLPTDRTFTGQKQDSTGLIYMNARYYDPALGQFLSPDTLVPDAGLVLDYNRYMYGRGNPLKYTDPSGHCPTKSNGVPDRQTAGSEASQCWLIADSIIAMWDSTDYWSNRYTSKDIFRQISAIPDNDLAWMKQEMRLFRDSPQEQARLQQYREMVEQYKNVPTDFDLGDYTVIGGQFGFLNPQLLIDDYGGVYASLGLGLGIPGVSVARNDILMDMVDIDQLNLNEAEKANAAAQALTGPSRSVSGGFLFVEFSLGWSVGARPQVHTVGGGTSFSPGPSAWFNLISLSGKLR